MKFAKSMILACALAAGLAAWGIPAKRVPRVVTQPDGTQLTLTLAGDEFCHYYLTDDEQIVMERDGAYYFAEADSEGRLVASDVLAADASKRDDQQRRMARKMQSVDLRQAIATSRALAPRQRAPYQAEEEGEPAVNTSAGIGLFPGAKYPTTGSPKGLVILVEYTDVKFSLTNDETHAYFSNMLNEPGFSQSNATGSAKDYFDKASSCQFQPEFDVLGPVGLHNNRKYYGGNDTWGNDRRPERMVMDAADILVDSLGIDFSVYDNDGDGIVDNVFVFYAGEGEAQSSVADAVWPHSWQLSSALWPKKGYQVGDVYLDSYACSNEILDSSGTMDGIGTFVHEFSHVMGLPDLYNTEDAYVSYTPDSYSVLDVGPYNNNSRTPPTYSVFERNALGWIDLTVINGQMDLELDNMNDSNQGYIILTPKKNEFFLLENRQKTGWDKYIPGHGMLIWHIDYNNSAWTSNVVNNTKTHQYVDLEEAGGKTGSTAAIKKQWPFPGTTHNTSFTDDTTPSMRTWSGEALNLPITDIKEVDGIITAKVCASSNGIYSIGNDAQGQLQLDGRMLTVSGLATVTDAMGRIIARGVSSATLPSAGIYIVNIDGRCTKIAVR